MKKNNLIILIVVTVVISVAALVASNMKDTAVSNQQAGVYIFPQLGNNINKVQEVEISKGKNIINIQRKDAAWQVLQKDGYAANLSKVKETILKLAEFKTLQAKTKKPENFGKLNVEDPKAENAKSILTTLKDENGNIMASLVIGRQLSGSVTAVGGEKTYVRKMDDKQVWLASGGLLIDDLAIDWLDEEIMDIPEQRISMVKIMPVDGKPLTIVKNKPEDKEFTLLNTPKNKQLKSSSDLAQTARLLQGLRMKDVAKADKVDMTTNPITKTEVYTFDGLVVSAVNMSKDDKHYITLSARFDAATRYEPTAPAEPTQTAEDKSASVPAAPAAPAVPLKAITDVQAEATMLNDKVTPWVYTLSKSKGFHFIKSQNDLLQEKQ